MERYLTTMSTFSSVTDSAGVHVQALQYLSKLCSHPLLVLDPTNPVHLQAVERATQVQASSPAAWKAIQPELHHLHHAPKLERLKQLLQVLNYLCSLPCHLLNGLPLRLLMMSTVHSLPPSPWSFFPDHLVRAA